MKNILLFLLMLSFSCQPKDRPGQYIQITGNNAAIPDGMVYLVEAGNWKSPLDSAKSVNGHFTFRIPADSSFIPFAAALHYLPEGNPLRPVRLQFQNPFVQSSGTDHFWLEPGVITITGNKKNSTLLQISAGPETELMMRHQLNDIGWMGERDSLKRKEKINGLKSEIARNPSSFFLLESIRKSKETYSKTEAVSLLSLFKPSLLASPPGKKMQAYLRLLPDPGAAYPILLLPGYKDSTEAMIDTTARVNMLVFWASWCMPCRKEIPLLRNLHQQYAKKGLVITSISIDQEKAQWEKAVLEEKMPWRQLLVNKERIETIENVFRFSTIPFIVFIDKNGIETGRFSDYDEQAAPAYEEIIKKHL